jgi:L-alanine-DL-glutamate epimerase-like enolase superfamily enzyme
MKAWFEKKVLHFKTPAGTSRGVMRDKLSWYLCIEENGIIGQGECSIIEGLSPDFTTTEKYEQELQALCDAIGTYFNDTELLKHSSSLLFGLEQAKLDYNNGGKRIYFDNAFAKGKLRIPINGLIWMGSIEAMADQVGKKISENYSCLKFKIGALDFENELSLLAKIRTNHPDLTIRVDANGSLPIATAQKLLKELALLGIHSIEQPIASGKWTEMATLCKNATLPIALDEELIGITDLEEKIKLLETIQPQYIILKPSLHGGFQGCSEWIALAEARNIGWWITSALESNLGLEAICQFVGEYETTIPQGLGTGGLYTNNIESDLAIENGEIYYKMGKH